MKSLVSLIWPFLILVACATSQAPTKMEKSYTDIDYSFSAVIPVVRPSKFGTERLIHGGTRLVEQYKTTNLVAYRDLNKVTRLSPSTRYPLTDAGWSKYLSESLSWNIPGWDFDPGTTAHVYLRPGGLGVDYVGEVVFVKDGRSLAFDSITGKKDAPDYYRAMKELGIYIP